MNLVKLSQRQKGVWNHAQVVFTRSFCGTRYFHPRLLIPGCAPRRGLSKLLAPAASQAEAKQPKQSRLSASPRASLAIVVHEQSCHLSAKPLHGWLQVKIVESKI